MKTSLILFTVVCLLGCKQSDVEPGAFTETSYPLKVGNWWRYKVSDSLSKTEDTLRLQIIGQTTKNDLTVYKCALMQRGTIVDSAQIIVSATQLFYEGLNRSYSYLGEFILKIPFYQGETWQGAVGTGITNATSYQTAYNVLGKKYDCYTLKRDINSFGYNFSQTFQVSRGIGLVSQYMELFDGRRAQQQTFQLIDYELK